MLLKITHQTDLSYTDLISESVMELRMAPRQEQDQHRLSFTLAVGPPTAATSYFDWLGNVVHAISISAFHSSIRIVASSVVETDRQKVEPERFSDRWPVAHEAFDYQMYDYLQFGGPVVDCQPLRDLVQILDPRDGMSLGEIGLRMLHVIDEKFKYQKGITTAASPITEILEHGQGVCQDFTHLMIAMARTLKIPSRYVSGVVHPEGERFRGYTQTHAWCELYFPSAGWIGFDPTNNCIVGPHFVKVATGRDYRDVAPNRGVYRGVAEEKIQVYVNTDILDRIPADLVPERVLPIDIPLYKDHAAAREWNTRQQEVEQQQQ